jgi:alkylated DNA repair dioxygenase AlkB
MSGASQRAWIHQVPKTKTVTEPRINLTFRRLVQP